MVIHRGDNLKAALCVEHRSLETERREQDLPAAAPASLLLCRPEQPCPQSVFTPRFLYPELADLQATAPGIPTDARDDSIPLVPHEDREPLAVRHARHARVELVESIFQILNLLRRRLRLDDEFRSTHHSHLVAS